MSTDGLTISSTTRCCIRFTTQDPSRAALSTSFLRRRYRRIFRACCCRRAREIVRTSLEYLTSQIRRELLVCLLCATLLLTRGGAFRRIAWSNGEGDRHHHLRGRRTTCTPARQCISFHDRARFRVRRRGDRLSSDCSDICRPFNGELLPGVRKHSSASMHNCGDVRRLPTRIRGRLGTVQRLVLKRIRRKAIAIDYTRKGVRQRLLVPRNVRALGRERCPAAI